MTIILIIGTITSVVGFLLIHQQLDKELASRFLYAGVGASLVTLSGFVIGWVNTSSVNLYQVFQFIFLSLGFVHVLLIFKFRLLGEKLAGSQLFSTLLTVVLSFAAALGFSLVSKNYLMNTNGMCATCIMPFAIPFFVYQSYKTWRELTPLPEWDFHKGDPVPKPPDRSEVKISFEFYIPRKYTGVRNIKGYWPVYFPQTWMLSSALHATLYDITARNTDPKINERHAKTLKSSAKWRFYQKKGWLGKKMLDPSKPLLEHGIVEGTVIYIKRRWGV